MKNSRENEIIVTVFTPTYNRADLIPDLFGSLVKQSCKNFEWVIVDDGSTDETEQLVRNWQNDCGTFPIIYKKKANGGKHTAINAGLEYANGTYFFIVDSDDYLKENAIELIIDKMKSISPKEFAGVGFNKEFENGRITGSSFKGDFIDCTSLERSKYNINGDKAEVFFTSLLKQYPFPVFEGEHFITEALVWNRIANDGYKIRWFNYGIYICRYQPDGLSLGSKVGKKSQGYSLFIKELIKYKSISFKEKTRWLGVYSDSMRDQGMTYLETARSVNAPILWIVLSNSIYRVVKKRKRVKYVNNLKGKSSGK